MATFGMFWPKKLFATVYCRKQKASWWFQPIWNLSQIGGWKKNMWNHHPERDVSVSVCQSRPPAIFSPSLSQVALLPCESTPWQRWGPAAQRPKQNHAWPRLHISPQPIWIYQCNYYIMTSDLQVWRSPTGTPSQSTRQNYVCAA